MSRLFDLTLNGVTYGTIYASVALGLVLIWRATRVINFAAGAMAMFTTYVAATLVDREVSYWLALAVALATGLIIGGVVERVLMRPVERRPPVNAVIVAIGLLIALEGTAGIVWGGGDRSFPAAFSQEGLTIGGRQIAFSAFDAFVLGAVVVLSLLLLGLFRATPAGLRMRAAALAPEIARLLGVRVSRVLTLGWALAGLAGSLAGLLVAPKVLLSPNTMDTVLVFGFTAAVLGGLDSVVGAVVGGLLTGLALSYVGGYVGSSLETLGAFVILGAVLMIRPQGLFSRRHARQDTGTAAASHGAVTTGGANRAVVPVGGLSQVAARISGRASVRQPLIRHGALALVAGGVLFVVTQVVSPYGNYQIANVAIYVIAIGGLTLLTGANGQVSLGHGAFMAVGAYTTALLLIHTAVPLPLAVLAGAVSAAAFGIVAGVAAARLRGPYLACLTLALAVGLPELSVKYAAVFGGEEGLSVPPAEPPGAVDPQQWLAWICLAAALLVLVVLANLMRSRFGRQFRAVRDDELASSLSGIPVARTQVLAFVVSGACAGLAGGLLGLSTSIVNPAEFPVALSISLLTGMVIGGTGSLVGAIWGGALLVYIPEWASSLSQQFNLSSGQSSNLALIIYGAALIVVIIVAPGGIQGLVRGLVGRSRALVRRLANA